MNRRRAAAAWAAAVIFSRTASAQTSAGAHDAIHFSYDAPAACPNKEMFSREVQERGTELHESDDATTSLAVTLEQDPNDAWHGTMRIMGTNRVAVRSIQATTCDELAHSLAIITSLALAPISGTAPANAEPSPRRATPPQPSAPTTIEEAPPATPRERESPDLLLHRRRLAIAGKGLLFVVRGGDAAGGGLEATFFLSERFGFGFEGDFLSATTADGGDEALGKVMAHFEVEAIRARGTLADTHNPVDIFFKTGMGAFWTRPDSIVDPEFRHFSFQPRLGFELGLGNRVFLSRFVAVTAEVGVLIFNEPRENSLVPPTAVERADSATWYGDALLEVSPLFQLGLEFLTPDARAAH